MEQLNVANSSYTCPSCKSNGMGVDVDANWNGTGKVIGPAREESIRCKGCEFVVCTACARGSLCKECDQYLQKIVDNLKAVKLQDDMFAFRGLSGRWYTLPLEQIIMCGDKGGVGAVCIFDNAPIQMPEDWSPSYKVAVDVGEGHPSYNALRFPTAEQADAYGIDLAMRWTLVQETAVEASDDAPTYTYIDYKLSRIGT